MKCKYCDYIAKHGTDLIMHMIWNCEKAKDKTIKEIREWVEQS